MKRLFSVLLFFSFFVVSNHTNAQSATSNYKATYSSDFKMGKAAYTNMVLDLWKDWEENKFDRHDYFADTIVMYFPDGTVLKGKAAAMESAKKYRGSMTSSVNVLHAVVPLMANNLGQDAVAIWGQETNNLNDGNVEVNDIHEVWFFNKAGKVVAMRQWVGKFGID